jgi:uncharacterized protein (TIGR03435 family)
MKAHPGINFLAAVLLFTIVTPASINSSQETTAIRPSFEVATIKPSSSKTYIPGGPATASDYFAWNATTLKRLVNTAYFVREWQMDWQIKGGTPGWVDSELWDVEGRAKAEEFDANQILQHYPGIETFDFRRISRDRLAQQTRLWLMVQSLLEERFKLRVERQPRQAPVYNLVVAKGGPKLKLDDDQSPPSQSGSGNPPPSGGAWELPRGQLMLRAGNRPPFEQSIEGRGIPIERLIPNLLNRAGRPIIDCTNLKGLYTFKIQWSEEDSGVGDSPLARGSLSLGPGFFTALQEQLGLRLESAKGPVEFLVIKSVQKPEDR